MSGHRRAHGGGENPDELRPPARREVRVPFDVSTLDFETDAVTGFGSQGFPTNAAWSRRSPSVC
jgi:hypothetical protein